MRVKVRICHGDPDGIYTQVEAYGEIELYEETADVLRRVTEELLEACTTEARRDRDAALRKIATPPGRN